MEGLTATLPTSWVIPLVSTSSIASAPAGFIDIGGGQVRRAQSTTIDASVRRAPSTSRAREAAGVHHAPRTNTSRSMDSGFIAATALLETARERLRQASAGMTSTVPLLAVPLTTAPSPTAAAVGLAVHSIDARSVLNAAADAMGRLPAEIAAEIALTKALAVTAAASTATTKLEKSVLHDEMLSSPPPRGGSSSSSSSSQVALILDSQEMFNANTNATTLIPPPTTSRRAERFARVEKCLNDDVESLAKAEATLAEAIFSLDVAADIRDRRSFGGGSQIANTSTSSFSSLALPSIPLGASILSSSARRSVRFASFKDDGDGKIDAIGSGGSSSSSRVESSATQTNNKTTEEAENDERGRKNEKALNSAPQSAGLWASVLGGGGGCNGRMGGGTVNGMTPPMPILSPPPLPMQRSTLPAVVAPVARELFGAAVPLIDNNNTFRQLIPTTTTTRLIASAAIPPIVPTLMIPTKSMEGKHKIVTTSRTPKLTSSSSSSSNVPSVSPPPPIITPALTQQPPSASFLLAPFSGHAGVRYAVVAGVGPGGRPALVSDERALAARAGAAVSLWAMASAAAGILPPPTLPSPLPTPEEDEAAASINASALWSSTIDALFTSVAGRRLLHLSSMGRIFSAWRRIATRGAELRHAKEQTHIASARSSARVALYDWLRETKAKRVARARATINVIRNWARATASARRATDAAAASLSARARALLRAWRSARFRRSVERDLITLADIVGERAKVGAALRVWSRAASHLRAMRVRSSILANSGSTRRAHGAVARWRITTYTCALDRAACAFRKAAATRRAVYLWRRAAERAFSYARKVAAAASSAAAEAASRLAMRLAAEAAAIAAAKAAEEAKVLAEIEAREYISNARADAHARFAALRRGLRALKFGTRLMHATKSMRFAIDAQARARAVNRALRKWARVTRAQSVNRTAELTATAHWRKSACSRALTALMIGAALFAAERDDAAVAAAAVRATAAARLSALAAPRSAAIAPPIFAQQPSTTTSTSATVPAPPAPSLAPQLHVPARVQPVSSATAAAITSAHTNTHTSIPLQIENMIPLPPPRVSSRTIAAAVVDPRNVDPRGARSRGTLLPNLWRDALRSSPPPPPPSPPPQVGSVRGGRFRRATNQHHQQQQPPTSLALAVAPPPPSSSAALSATAATAPFTASSTVDSNKLVSDVGRILIAAKTRLRADNESPQSSLISENELQLQQQYQMDPSMIFARGSVINNSNNNNNNSFTGSLMRHAMGTASSSSSMMLSRASPGLVVAGKPPQHHQSLHLQPQQQLFTYGNNDGGDADAPLTVADLAPPRHQSVMINKPPIASVVSASASAPLPATSAPPIRALVRAPAPEVARAAAARTLLTLAPAPFSVASGTVLVKEPASSPPLTSTTSTTKTRLRSKSPTSIPVTPAPPPRGASLDALLTAATSDDERAMLLRYALRTSSAAASSAFSKRAVFKSPGEDEAALSRLVVTSPFSR